MLSAPALLRPHVDEGVALALRDELVVLIEGAVQEFDDTGAGPRLRFTLAQHLDEGQRILLRREVQLWLIELDDRPTADFY